MNDPVSKRIQTQQPTIRQLTERLQAEIRQFTEPLRVAHDAFRQCTEWQQMYEDVMRQHTERQRMEQDAIRQLIDPLRAGIGRPREPGQFMQDVIQRLIGPLGTQPRPYQSVQVSIHRTAKSLGSSEDALNRSLDSVFQSRPIAAGLGVPHTDLSRACVSVVETSRDRQSNDCSLIASQITPDFDVTDYTSTNFYESTHGLWLPSIPLPSATQQLAAFKAWHQSYAPPSRRASRNAYIARARAMSHWFVLRCSIIFHRHFRSLLAPHALRMRWLPSIKHADMPAFSPALA
jgi:hypothetical protein